MAFRLGWDADTIADRITLTLPLNFFKEQTGNIWKLMRSAAEIFKVNTDGIDELFQQTNISSASGEFLDDYVEELTGLKRKSSETDADFLERYCRNVFVYNSTKEGIREITLDVVGEYPLALIDKDRGASFDALYFYNDGDYGARYGGGTEPYVGYIILRSQPTDAQMDELCALINRHKPLGVKIYIQYRKYDIYTGYSYEEIAVLVTDQSSAKVIGPAAYGDFYDAAGFYNDTNEPAFYGDEDESALDHKYLYIAHQPTDGELDELLESLSENLEPGDQLYLMYPAD